jgi:FkbM family methyltransferase
MELRRLARPLISAAERAYRNPTCRRLMIEAREEFDDTIVTDISGHVLKLRVTSRMEHQRAVGVLTKEPDTIAWLDRLGPGDLFVDIGANIGVYSLYAAIVRKARVVAFEPEAQNFAALVRNVALNGLSERVSAWPYAIAAEAGPIRLNLSAITSGGSQHAAGEAINELGQVFKPAFIQGAVAIELDRALALVADGQCPRFLKIDIDGAEEHVARGMAEVLSRLELEEILIEMPVERSEAAPVYDLLEGAGFRPQAPAWINKGRGNIIFSRSA